MNTSRTGPSSSSIRSSYSRTASQSHDEFVNDMISSNLGTDEHTTVLVKYGLMAVGILAVLKIMWQSLVFYTLLASPFLYGYLKTSCPSQDSFDAKEELKIILGGQHLPDAHPDKPKSKLQQFISSTKANVTAEYSALVDMQVEFTDIAGCGVLAKVTSQNQTHYWVGASHKWRFVYSTPAAAGEAAPADTSNGNRQRSSVSASGTSAAAAAMASLTGSMKSTSSSKSSKKKA